MGRDGAGAGERKRHGRHYTPSALAEFLAGRVAARVVAPQSGLRVLDPACGGGELLFAIQAALAERLPGVPVELVGYDLDPEGLQVARERAARAGIAVDWRQADFLAGCAALRARSFHVVIANPPYVRTQQLGGEAAQALRGQFGLRGRFDLTHPFVAAVPRLLVPGGVFGLLCANRFLTTKAGANLRAVLLGELAPVELYDLGDTKLFDAAVLPAVTIAVRGQARDRCRYVSVYQESPDRWVSRAVGERRVDEAVAPVTAPANPSDHSRRGGDSVAAPTRGTRNPAEGVTPVGAKRTSAAQMHGGAMPGRECRSGRAVAGVDPVTPGPASGATPNSIKPPAVPRAENVVAPGADPGGADAVTGPAAPAPVIGDPVRAAPIMPSPGAGEGTDELGEPVFDARKDVWQGRVAPALDTGPQEAVDRSCGGHAERDGREAVDDEEGVSAAGFGPRGFAADFGPVAVEADLFEALGADTDATIRWQGRRFAVTVGELAVPAGSASVGWRMARVGQDDWLDAVAARMWRTFGDLARIRVGIKTNADSVFIAADWGDPDTEPELLCQLITHHDLRPWRVERTGRTRVLYPYVLDHPRRMPVDLMDYPRTAAYLEQYREALSARTYLAAAGRKWFEHWVPQRPHLWRAPKVVFPDISDRPRFALDRSGAVVNGDCYWISLAELGDEWPVEELAYLMMGVANSALGVRFYDAVCGNRLYSGRRRWITQYVSRLPLPDPATAPAIAIVRLVRELAQGPDPVPAMQHELDELVNRAFAL
ncbi:Eco57I restriction-modification methylase domain-containing protein [Nocardia flavorosea]|uniref:Eco57I restriction-modification methylase domain-containing protein n=1 Tax=Nocardia flavorosea TaxID=53429 RepID=UPI001E4BB70D|nr:N-6 DNA methylase [Nocardia flavorosea]